MKGSDANSPPLHNCGGEVIACSFGTGTTLTVTGSVTAPDEHAVPALVVPA